MSEVIPLYTYEDFSAARDHLKGREFAGMTGYDAYHYLEQPLLEYMRANVPIPSGAGWLFPFVANNFEFDLSQSAKGKNVFYYSGYYQTRKDCLAFLEKITGAIDDPLPLVGRAGTRFRLSNLFNLFRYISWSFALRGMKLDKKGRRYLKYRLAFCVNFRRFLEKNAALLDGMRSMMTLNDENYDENIFVQFCRKRGVPTFDLEHGHYNVTERGEDLTRVTNTLENFTSDYYFAWGDYAKRVAIESGVPEEKIVTVGNPKFIGFNDFPEPSREKVFGVVLDGGGTASLDSNRGMLRAADAIAAKYGYKYILKPHPVYDMSLLDGAYDKNNVVSICEKFKTVRDFASEVCFSLASGSSVYAELLYMRQIVFRYVHPGNRDGYLYLGGGDFSDEKAAFDMVEAFESDPEQFRKQFVEYAEALCGKGDIGENYRRAVNDLANKGD